MRWIRPHHTRWLAACLLGLLLSVWAGGLSFTLVMVFATIAAAGAALIALDLPSVPESGGDAGNGDESADDVLDDVLDDVPDEVPDDAQDVVRLSGDPPRA